MLWLLALTCASGLKVTMKADVSPIEKIVQLIGDLEGKLIKDSENTQQIYEEFTDWCKMTAKETQFAIKTAQSESERHAAKIDSSGAEIATLETKIGELSESIASNEKDLKSGTAIRKTEKEDFNAADKELAETIGALRRAISIMEKEMSSSSFVQTDSMTKVSDALMAMIEASSVNTVDKAKLSMLIQSSDSSEDGLSQPDGAPDPANYEAKSGGIVSTMNDMLEKSEAQSSEGQKNEMNSAHAFNMMKLSLETSIKTETKELSDAKKAKGAAEEVNAAAAGELERVKTEIAADQKKLKDLQHECMTKAEEHTVAQKECGDELTALATAKKIILETTGGAAEKTYDSFVQLKVASKMHMKEETTRDRIVAALSAAGKATGARALVQLSERVRSEMLSGNDPFAKVKGMIQEMMEKLIQEAQEEAEKKAFCDKEMSESEAKRDDKQDEVDDLNTKIDKSTARIAKLQENVVTLEEELAQIQGEQKTATEMREKEKAAFTAAKADFEQGLGGVQMALEVLRDYYAQKDDAAESMMQLDSANIGNEMSLAQSGTMTKGPSGIIGMLEVAEADFTKMLSEGQTAEDQLQKEYDTMTEDNKITTAKKRAEVTHQIKSIKETGAYLEETKEDLGTSQTELDAILEYYEKLRPQCVAKPEPYEERKKRREKEIAGLKQALAILESESAPAFLAIRAQ